MHILDQLETYVLSKYTLVETSENYIKQITPTENSIKQLLIMI